MIITRARWWTRRGRRDASSLSAPAVAAPPDPAAPSRYATTPKRPQFEGEHLPGNTVWRGSVVHYLCNEELTRYRLTSRDGRLFDAEGEPFDTRDAHSHWSGDGSAIFVMHGNGAIYSSKQHLVGRFHHSSLGQGQPVAGAGELVVHEGRLRVLTDHSSHYCPSRQFTRQVLDELAAGGVDTEALEVRLKY